MAESRKVLVVDDEVDLREIIAFDFETLGFETFLAEDGLEALEIHKKDPMDLIVSDVKLPKLSGIQLLEEIKKSNAGERPIFMLITGYSSAITIEDAYAKGASGWFLKPFNRRSLVSEAMKCLTPRKQRWIEVPKEKPTQNIALELNSVAEGLAQHQFGVGLGGLSVVVPEVAVKNGELVNYSLTFKSDQWALSGIGTIRWQVKDSSLAGKIRLGIEFVHLPENLIEKTAELQKQSNPVAFIPKA